MILIQFNTDKSQRDSGTRQVRHSTATFGRAPPKLKRIFCKDTQE